MQGMIPENGYVWFLPAWFTRTWYNQTNDAVKRPWIQPHPCSLAEMLSAVQGHFFLNSAFLGPVDSRIAGGNVTVLQWERIYAERVKRLVGAAFDVFM